MNCIFYSFLDWLIRIGDDGEREYAASGGMCVAAMLYMGSILSILDRLGYDLDSGLELIAGIAFMGLTYFKYINDGKFKAGLKRYRATDHNPFCRKSYWIILLSPVVLAISIYIKWRT
jgi:hypothetical protein